MSNEIVTIDEEKLAAALITLPAVKGIADNVVLVAWLYLHGFSSSDLAPIYQQEFQAPLSRVMRSLNYRRAIKALVPVFMDTVSVPRAIAQLTGVCSDSKASPSLRVQASSRILDHYRNLFPNLSGAIQDKQLSDMTIDDIRAQIAQLSQAASDHAVDITPNEDGQLSDLL